METVYGVTRSMPERYSNMDPRLVAKLMKSSSFMAKQTSANLADLSFIASTRTWSPTMKTVYAAVDGGSSDMDQIGMATQLSSSSIRTALDKLIGSGIVYTAEV